MVRSDCVLDFAVLIPYFNNMEGLVSSLKNINYHRDKLYVVIVDDGSKIKLTDDQLSKLVLLQFKYTIINLPVNGGITHALNTGLEWIKDNLTVSFIARLDCGDICHQERFNKQVAFLHSHSEVYLVGSWCKFKSKDGKINYNYVTPTEHEDILKEMHCRNTFIHPTVMFRSSIISSIGYYPYEYTHVEDYAFFWRIIKAYKSAILNEFLVTCEVNSSGISIKNRQEQLTGRWKVINDFAHSNLLKLRGRIRLLMLRVIPYKLLVTLK